MLLLALFGNNPSSVSFQPVHHLKAPYLLHGPVRILAHAVCARLNHLTVFWQYESLLEIVISNLIQLDIARASLDFSKDFVMLLTKLKVKDAFLDVANVSSRDCFDIYVLQIGLVDILPDY
jgi:hypothetical protein